MLFFIDTLLGKKYMNECDISFVVPVYNASLHLEEWKKSLLKVIEPLKNDWEIILIDDGSIDNSWKIIESWAKDDQRFRAYGLSKNFGQHPAMTLGLELARGRIIMTMDDDLQIPHDCIPVFIEKLENDVDIVAGRRRTRNDSLIFRQLPSLLLNKIMRKISKVMRNDFGCNNVAYKRWVIEAVMQSREKCRFLPELVGWAGGRIKEVEVEHRVGPSRYRFSKLIKLNLELLTNYNLWFIYLWICIIGAVTLFFGILMCAVTTYAILNFKIGIALLGIFIFVIGLVGTQLNRLQIEIQDRPLYVVSAGRIQDSYCDRMSRNKLLGFIPDR